MLSVFLLASSELRKIRAKKVVEFHELPRVGEFINFGNVSTVTFVVNEVTHSFEGDEPGIRVWPSDLQGGRETIGDDDLARVIEVLTEQDWTVWE